MIQVLGCHLSVGAPVLLVGLPALSREERVSYCRHSWQERSQSGLTSLPCISTRGVDCFPSSSGIGDECLWSREGCVAGPNMHSTATGIRASATAGIPNRKLLVRPYVFIQGPKQKFFCCHIRDPNSRQVKSFTTAQFNPTPGDKNRKTGGPWPNVFSRPFSSLFKYSDCPQLTCLRMLSLFTGLGVTAPMLQQFSCRGLTLVISCCQRSTNTFRYSAQLPTWLPPGRLVVSYWCGSEQEPFTPHPQRSAISFQIHQPHKSILSLGPSYCRQGFPGIFLRLLTGKTVNGQVRPPSRHVWPISSGTPSLSRHHLTTNYLVRHIPHSLGSICTCIGLRTSQTGPTPASN